MSFAHTPGPWHRNVKPGIKYPVIFSGRNTHVAIAQTRGLSDAEVEANIDLIAAAPALLATLKELQDSATYWSEYDVPVGIVARINAAIDRAEGRA